MPLERHEIYVTFAPTTDDTARTSLPTDVRLALKTHKRLFFSRGLTLHIASSFPTPPRYIFHAALLTLLSLEQHEKVSTPFERPRQGSDILAGIPHQGHARGTQKALMDKAQEDDDNGTRGLPWLTPSLTVEGKSLR